MTKRLKRKGMRWSRKSVLFVLLFSLLISLAVQQLWRDQHVLQWEEIYVSGAPQEFDGFSIAIISDLHGKEFGERNQTLLIMARLLKPDIIAITGDLIHDAAQLEMVPALARGLAAIAPTYYVTGTTSGRRTACRSSRNCWKTAA